MIAFADSAAAGMPSIFVVATYVYQDRRRTLLYRNGGAGPCPGSIPPYTSSGIWAARKCLRKRISRRGLKIHQSFEAQ